MLVELVKLQTHGDERGALVVLEQTKNIPFEIRRVYYMFNTGENVRRGFHAHKNLKQLAIAVSGSCRFLLDDGKEKTEVVLDEPSEGLIIHSCIWHEMYDFSEDCVLMVVADQLYDEADYIRNYDDFLRLIKS